MVSPRESIDAYSMRGRRATTGELFRRARHVYRSPSIVRRQRRSCVLRRPARRAGSPAASSNACAVLCWRSGQ